MAQPYGTLNGVKNKLGMPTTDTSIDTELTEVRDEADDWIDMNLKDLVTVPLATVPDEIKNISETRAAGFWYVRKSADPSYKPAYLTIAEKDLETYRTRTLIGAKASTAESAYIGKTSGNKSTQ